MTSAVANCEFKKDSHIQEKILIVGPRQCGKTTLAKNLTITKFKNKNIDKIIVFSCNNLDYDNFVDKCYNNDTNTIISVFKKLIKNKPKEKILIIIDEYDSTKLLNNDVFRTVFNNNNISMIICQAHVSGIHPELRVKLTDCYFFYINMISDLKRIYECYFGMIETFDRFIDLYKKYTCYYTDTFCALRLNKIHDIFLSFRADIKNDNIKLPYYDCGDLESSDNEELKELLKKIISHNEMLISYLEKL